MSSPVAPLLRALSDRRYEALGPLPAGCRVGDLTATPGPLPDTLGRGWLGAGPCDFLAIPLTGFADGIRIWFDAPPFGPTTTEAAPVRMLDAAYPPPGRLSMPALLDALGPPDTHLDLDLDGLTLTGGCHLWLRRGLALHINPGNVHLLRITIFAPTDLSSYQHNLDLDTHLRPFPHRHEDPFP
ncbi:MAG TPA: hypothetical protein VGR06_42660 [Actinophytocola sp.]|jgi:hypothetical protein|uniref:hypothetical protein n=1 Tax=Actinophytocola sp. TaxID=1872138 RepID=UPI002E049B93|nr:hypothetical protein [Actinophytocola sp.]